MCRGGGFSVNEWNDNQRANNRADENREDARRERERKNEQGKLKIFSQQTGDHVSFYAPYGDKECTHATDWCKKHCYLKSKPFDAKTKKEIGLGRIGWFRSSFLTNIIKKSTAKYFTIFSSGCIEDLGIHTHEDGEWCKWENFAQDIVWANKTKKVRFFIKSLERKVLNMLENGVIILTVDISSYKKLLKKALKIENIRGIAVINHKDNKEVVDLLTNKAFLFDYGIFNVIDCKDCKGQMLCFNQKERFVLIQEYK